MNASVKFIKLWNDGLPLWAKVLAVALFPVWGPMLLVAVLFWFIVAALAYFVEVLFVLTWKIIR